MDELKPCPFCGGKAILIFDDDGTHIASCKRLSCFAFRWKDEARYETEAEAIEAWNRRIDNVR